MFLESSADNSRSPSGSNGSFSPPSSDVSLPPSNLLQDGKYKVVKVLGKGGFGKVFLCEHMELRRPVAIKLLLEKHATSRTLKRYLRREAEVLFDLNHPNVVKVYDLHHEVGVGRHIVMEYLVGPSLKDLMCRRNGVDLPQAVELSCQLLDGLNALHSKGIAHCDISPDNMIVGSGSVGKPLLKIIDLGAAKIGGEDLCQSRVDVCKAKYRSPERWGGRIGSPSCDIYSAGIVIYEMLSGEYPYEIDSFDSDAELASAHLSQDPRAFHEGSRPIPDALQDIVFPMLSKDPSDREVASDLLERLRLFQEKEGKLLALANVIDVSLSEGIDFKTTQIGALLARDGEHELVDTIAKSKSVNEDFVLDVWVLRNLGSLLHWGLPLLVLVGIILCLSKLAIILM